MYRCGLVVRVGRVAEAEVFAASAGAVSETVQYSSGHLHEVSGYCGVRAAVRD